MKIFFALSLFFLNLFASEEIWVELETENNLMPLYVSPPYTDDAELDFSYLQKLKEVLAFDFNYNGMTEVITATPEKDKIITKGSFADTLSSGDLEKLKAFYLIKWKVSHKKLSISVINANNNSVKTAEGIDLTGDIARDRRKVHAVSDKIFKGLFGFDGIASTKILYTIKAKNSAGQMQSEIYEGDYDGSNLRAVTQNAGYVVTPTYVSPQPGHSAGSIFYVSYKNGQPKIFYTSLKEFKPIRFSLLKGNQFMPCISKQRDKVAFICDVTGNPDLFMQKIKPDGSPEGKPYQIFATHKATQGTPTFSPDGSKIAFVSNKDGSPRVYMMPVPESGTSLKDIKAKLLSRSHRESTAPAWSPDGKKIAYTTLTSGVRQIWVYDLDKNKERQLTQGAGHKENPSWAPDSLHIVFNSTGHDGAEIHLINLNQSKAVQISKGPGEKRFPAWEPL